VSRRRKKPENLLSLRGDRFSTREKKSGSQDSTHVQDQPTTRRSAPYSFPRQGILDSKTQLLELGNPSSDLWAAVYDTKGCCHVKRFSLYVKMGVFGS
jgi:hypothetical protein